MESTILKTVGQIAGIGGLSIGVFLLLFKDLLKKLKVPGLTRNQWFKVIVVFMCMVWSIGVIGLLLWFFTSRQISDNQKYSSVQIDSTTKKKPMITFHYDSDSQDGLPYGFFYWGTKNKIDKIVALPYSIKQMHAIPQHTFPPNGSMLNDVPPDADVSQTPKASFSTVIVNDSTKTLIVEKVNLIIEKHQPLPERFIAIWHRKGFVHRTSVQISLSPKQKEYTLYHGSKTVYELSTGESFPLRLILLGAEPGLYTFHIEAIGVFEGKLTTFQSQSLRIASLDPEKIDNT